jgi:hypothetical protein
MLDLLDCSPLRSMWSLFILNHAKHLPRPVNQHVLSGIHDPEVPVDTQSSHVMTVSNLVFPYRRQLTSSRLGCR